MRAMIFSDMARTQPKCLHCAWGWPGPKEWISGGDGNGFGTGSGSAAWRRHGMQMLGAVGPDGWPLENSPAAARLLLLSILDSGFCCALRARQPDCLDAWLPFWRAESQKPWALSHEPWWAAAATAPAVPWWRPLSPAQEKKKWF